METTTERHPRGFATISTPDGRQRIWIYRPQEIFIDIACSFTLNGRMGFVDAIDRLKYVRVEEARMFDDNYSTLMLSCQQNPGDCLEQLMEDLPKLMEDWL